MRDFKVGDFFLILPQTLPHLKHVEENDMCRITSVEEDFITYETIIKNSNVDVPLKRIRKNSYFLNVMTNFDISAEEIERIVKEHQERAKYKMLLMTRKVREMFSWIDNNNGDSDVKRIVRDVLNPEKRTSKEINGLSLLEEGFEYTPGNKEIEVNSDGTWTSKVRQKGKFGKILNKILIYRYSDYSLEKTANAIKSYIGIFGDENGQGKYQLEFVHGEDIRKYYSENTYTNLYRAGNNLFGSCMRYSSCSPFFNLYVENPEICSMAILKDPEGRIAGRAIVWFDGTDYYMDRIYTTDGLIQIFKQHAMDNGWYFKSQQSNSNYFDRKGKGSGSKNIYLPVKYHYEWYFPYMDTVLYIDTNKHVLTNKCPDYNITMRGQSGGCARNFTYGKNKGYNGFYKCGISGNIVSENDVLKDVEVYTSEYDKRQIEYVAKNVLITLYNGELCYRRHDNLRSAESEYFLAGDPNFIQVDGKWQRVKVEEEKPKSIRKKESSKN